MRKSRKQATCLNNKTRHTVIDKTARTPNTLPEINKKSGKDNAYDNDGCIFPRWMIWMVVLVTLGLRMRYVTDTRQWWILHPDEIYQTIEVAHTAAYGYGFRAYEYLQFPRNDVTNTSTPEFQAQQLRNGMYSLRSFMLPTILAMFLKLCEFAGIQASPYLKIKILHAVVTSFLPMTLMRFVNTVTGSRDQGMLAAIFVSASTTLNVLGTHSFINTFLATFLFLSLETLAKCLKTYDTYVIEKNIFPSDECVFRRDQTLDSHTDSSKSGSLDEVIDLNANSVDGKEHNIYNREIINVNTKHLMVRNSNEHVYEATQGFVLGACIYVRIDMILVPMLFTTFMCVRCWTEGGNLRSIYYECRHYVLGISLGIFLGGYFDYLFYASWFMSPVQWVRFNVFSNKASVVFGSSPSWFYIDALFEVEPLLKVVLCMIIFHVLFECYLEYTNYVLFHKGVLSCVLSHFWSLIICVCIFIVYSNHRHKEMRFVHDGVIFLYIYLARAIMSLFKTFTHFCVNQNLHMHCISFVYVLVFLFASSHLTQFYCMTSAGQSKWTYGGVIDSAEVNSCLNFIGHQHDVTGIFIDRPIHMTGGYSIIHKDVPIIAINKYEFVEFDGKSKVALFTYNLGIQTWPFTHSNNAQRLNTFGHISDFISIYNTPYLYKKLINRSEYNYLVLEADREFENLGGFAEVFRTQSSKVMRRTFEPDAEQALLDRARMIPIGTNATVLEHEGHWLAHYGLYKLAEERLVFANYIAPRELGPYRRLLEIYTARRNSDFYSKVLNTCMQFHSMRDCTRPYQPVELHSEYFK